MKANFFNPTLTSVLSMILVFPSTSILSAQIKSPAPNRARTVLAAPLPAHMQGDALRATLITVQYGPGEASQPHTHGCPVIVYVLEGSIRSRIGSQQEVTYSAGDSFYEPPGGPHAVSANASNEKAARFLAFFVCDRDVPLSSALSGPTQGAK